MITCIAKYKHVKTVKRFQVFLIWEFLSWWAVKYVDLGFPHWKSCWTEILSCIDQSIGIELMIDLHFHNSMLYIALGFGLLCKYVHFIVEQDFGTDGREFIGWNRAPEEEKTLWRPDRWTSIHETLNPHIPLILIKY